MAEMKSLTIHGKQYDSFPVDVDSTLTISGKPADAKAVGDALSKIEVGGGSADLTGYATEDWVQKGYQPKGDYLESDELPSAVNTALAQAKASGEFDGKDGSNGKDGVSATHSWNGTTLTVTSASGTSSANLKGDKGDKGDTGGTGAAGTSVTVKSVSESTADGGSNVVTFSDGKTLTVKNGSKGSTGSKGDKGDKGDTGATGATGSTGAAGKNGADGYTPVRGTDYWTEADKVEIVQRVIETLGGSPIFGIVDESNNIVVSGDLPDGTYSVKYEMENGSKVNIGNLVIDTNVYYTVTNTLTQCTNSNSATKVVQGSAYSATITANSGYELKSVTATMGGTAVSVSNGKINIASVTGNIVITAVAEKVQTGPTNLADPTSADWQTDTRLATSYGYGKTLAGFNFTNYIPCKAGDVLRIKGLNMFAYVSSQYAAVAIYTSTDKTANAAGRYNAYQYYTNLGAASSVSSEGAKEQVSVNGDVYTYTILKTGNGTQLATSDTAYCRISATLADGYTKNDVVITINEEIA